MPATDSKIPGIQAKATPRPRKSRSAGLRCKTGCITCRQRHKKCDEIRPTCTNCTRARRDCVYDVTSQVVRQPASLPIVDNRAQRQDIPNHRASVERSFQNASFGDPTPEEAEELYTSPQNIGSHRQQIDQSQAAYQYAYSPGETVVSTDFLTADLASVRWLDLLASDAIQADRGFSLASTPIPFEELQDPGYGNTRTDFNSNLLQAAATSIVNVERLAWQSDRAVVLHDHQILIFKNFVERCSRWLDVFDPQQHFSSKVIRLAVRPSHLSKRSYPLSRV